VAAGTAKSFIMDEVGKYPFSAALKLQNLHSKELMVGGCTYSSWYRGHLIKVKMLRISFIIQKQITF
jgi:hypothetical protein